MEEVRITMDLESGEWKVNIYEVGNTYQIYAEHIDDENKVVHFMINKNAYLDELKKQKAGKKFDKYNGLSCKGEEVLTEKDFESMRDKLYELMDADLQKEKIRIGLI